MPEAGCRNREKLNVKEKFKMEDLTSLKLEMPAIAKAAA